MSQLYSTEIRVRFRDLDAMGHVNNAVFFTYFEEGRKSFFMDLFGVSDPSQFGFILAHISCDYLRPVTMNTGLSLQLWIGEQGRKSFVFGYRLVDSSDQSFVYARGESVQVCFDYRLQKSVEISGELRKKLARFQAEKK